MHLSRLILGRLRGHPNEAEENSWHSEVPAVLDGCTASAKPVLQHSLDFRPSFSADMEARLNLSIC